MADAPHDPARSPVEASDGPPRDRHGRPLANLRLSVTDRCNLRCAYCMPEEDYVWLPRRDVLSFEETAELVGAFVALGVRKLRLTGGEPLLRRDLDRLVAVLSAHAGVEDLALTTNAVLLDEQAAPLRAAGLDRLTISLDTLDRERFRALTRRDELTRVLRGIDAAAEAGFTGSKLNVVVMRGVNDDELGALVRFGAERALEVRFIEYMDVGGATRWESTRVVPRDEVLARLGEEFGGVRPLPRDPTDPASLAAPAERFQLGDGTAVGLIASTTRPFCGTCDRSRLTADGRWFRCLYAREGTDLRGPLRAGATRQELVERIAGTWNARTDRGAEERLRERERSPLATPPELRADPHLEMHTRGG